MLNSKQIIEMAGISRATLNNYVALGILPNPVVKTSPDDAGRAAQSFPPMDWDVVEARGLSPPLVPKLRSDTDTNNFDREFTRMGVEESPEEETAFLSAEAQSALTPEAFSGFSYAPETPLGRVSAEEDAQRSQGGEGGGAAAAGSADEVLQAQLSQTAPPCAQHAARRLKAPKRSPPPFSAKASPSGRGSPPRSRPTARPAAAERSTCRAALLSP